MSDFGKSITTIADLNPSVSISDLPDDLPISFVGMADVSEGGLLINKHERLLRDVKSGFTRFIEGDVLFAKITPCMENGKGALAKGLRNKIGFGSTEFHVFRNKQNGDAGFIYQVLQSQDLRLKAEARMTGSAGQQRVPAEFFDFYKTFIPTFLPEQRKIARILSTADAVIEKTQAAIAKYKAIKQGMLHDLFTRGIDPATGKLRPAYKDAPELYKPSKLGWIPKEWKEGKFLDFADERISHSFTGGPFGSDLQTKHYTKSGVRIIQLQNIGDGVFNDGYKIFTSVEKANQLINCNIYPGEIIISKMADPISRACLIPNTDERFLMASDGIRLSINKKKFNSRFVMETINQKRFRTIAEIKATGSTRARIGLTELREIPVAYPNKVEQDAIGQRLDTVEDKIQTEQTYLYKLQQIKAGLMADLLSGKKQIAVNENN